MEQNSAAPLRAAGPPSQPSPDSWVARIMAASLIYSLTVVVLGFWIPTDHPRRPGDDWRGIGKAYIGLAVVWLFFRWYARHRAWCDARASSLGARDPRRTR